MSQSRTTKVIALSLGSGLTALVGLVSTMVLARVLTITDYATYRQTMLAYHFAEPLLTLALPMALYYFLPAAGKRERGVLLDNIVLLTLMGSVFSLFLLCGGNRLLALRFNNPDLAGALRWLIPYPLLVMPAAALSAVMVVKGRTTALSIYNVCSRLVLAVAIIGSSLIYRNYLAPVISQVVWAAVMLLPALYLAFSSTSPGILGLRPAMMLSMLKYSVPLGLATMLGTITLQLDKMIVSAMCTPEQFAIYVNGAIEIPIIGMITGAIATVILADMSIACRNGRHGDAQKLFQKAAIRSSMILMPTMVFLFIHAHDFIVLVYSEKYVESILPFRIFLLALPIRTVNFGSALMALGMTRAVFWRSFAGVLMDTFLTTFLVSVFGYQGAAPATVLTLYLCNVPLNLFLIAKGFGCRSTNLLPIGRMMLILILSIPGAVISYVVFSMIPALPLRFSASLILFALAYFMALYVILPDSRVALQSIIDRFPVVSCLGRP